MPRQYLVEGYSYSFAPDALVSEFSTRNRRQRSYHDNPDTIFNVRERLDATEFAAFESWVMDTLNNGADTFSGNYWDGSVEKTADMTIVNGIYSHNYESPESILVSYQIEVKNRSLENGRGLYESFVAGVPFENNYLQAVEDAVNNNGFNQ